MLFHTELLTSQIQHLFVFQPALQVIFYLHGAYARRSARIKEVARLQREEPTDIGYQLVDCVEHVGRLPLLPHLTINGKAETNALHA